VVHLVDHAVIKRGCRREGRERLGAGLPERGLGLREDFCSVGDHEHPRRPAQLAAHGDHVERREPGFTKARGHGDEGF